MPHIDEWIDEPCSSTSPEAYAKFVFLYMRTHAWMQDAFRPWMSQFKLFCTFQGKRFRCTGASRLGDVWLTEDFEKSRGYEHRVDVDECSDWSDKP